MFSTKARLRERQGKYGTPRAQYLQELVSQFQSLPDTAASLPEKERIVARLANFAYDPINWDYLRRLNALELFLDCLAEEGSEKELLVECAMGGLFNASAGPQNAAAILAFEDSLPLISSGLSSPVTNTVLSSLGCLYFLCTPATRQALLTPQVKDLLRQYSESEHARFRNMAQAFLRRHGGLT